eukprot:609753-Prymnesium_polylepis.1
MAPSAVPFPPLLLYFFSNGNDECRSLPLTAVAAWEGKSRGAVVRMEEEEEAKEMVAVEVEATAGEAREEGAKEEEARAAAAMAA